MEDRYWLRHPSLHGHQGPFPLTDLQKAVGSGSLPRDSDVLLDRGQDEAARRQSTGWQPVTDVLGLPPAPRLSDRLRPEVDDQERRFRAAEARLQNLRANTAYTRVRTVVTVLALVAAVLVVVLGFVVMSKSRGDGGLVMLVAMALEVIGIYVAHALLQALLDIADSAVRRHPDADAERHGPS
jgi:hypothetical protein